MRSFYARSVMIAVGAFCLANGVWAQAQYNAPSILPNAPARQLNPWAQSAGFRGMNSNYGGYSPQFYSVATPTEAPPPVPATPKLAAPESILGPNNPGQPMQPFLPQGQPQFQQRQPYQNSYEHPQQGPGRFQPQFQQPYSQQYQQQPGSQYSPTPYDGA